MTLLRFALLSATAIAFTLPAHAAIYEAAPKIDAVTLYPGEAQAKRMGTVTLDKGEHSLIIKGLPAQLDTASFRVRASAPFDIALGSIAFRPVKAAPLPPEKRDETRKAIAVLEQERETQNNAIQSAQMQLKFLEGLNDSNPGTKADPAAIKTLLGVIGEGADHAFAAQRKASQRKAEIEGEIARLKAQGNGETPLERPSLEAVIALTSEGAGAANLVVEYAVPNGGRWTPLYEARLSTTKPEGGLSLVTRAEVSQTSGEDWNDVELTLSTTRPSRDSGPRPLSAMIAQFYSAMPVALRAMAPAPAAPKAVMDAARDQAAAEMEASARRKEERAATEAEAGLEAEGLSFTYRIPGRISLPSSKPVRSAALLAETEKRAFRINSETLTPRFYHYAVPKQNAAAFLMAEVTKPGDAPLLSGPLTLYRDNVLVGRSALPFTPAGETLKFGFGEDERIRVTYAPVKQQEGETGLFGSSMVQRKDMRIAIKNNAATPVSLVVEDQLPVSENTEIKVEPLSTNTPATKNKPEDRRGVVQWVFDLKPQEQKDIRFGWQVKWPSDRAIKWENAPK